MLIAQISDLHVTAPGGHPRGIDAVANLRRAVEVLNTLRPRPDLVVATGDLVDHGLDEEYKLLFGVLNELELPLAILPGNHDDAPLLRMHLHLHGHLRADEPGHLGTVVDGPDVRVVLVDTTDPSRHDGVFPEGRAAWLDAVLSAAPDRPTFVAMHHPAFATGIWWMDAMGIVPADRERFEAIIRAHPQVRHVAAGHIHRAIGRTWGSTMLTVCPSTVHQVGLGLGREAAAVMTFEAPSLQLHQWTGDGFVTHTRPLDVPQMIDISALVPDWERAKDRFALGGPYAKGESLF